MTPAKQSFGAPVSQKIAPYFQRICDANSGDAVTVTEKGNPADRTCVPELGAAATPAAENTSCSSIAPDPVTDSVTLLVP
jgi:hypothetical protein